MQPLIYILLFGLLLCCICIIYNIKKNDHCKSKNLIENIINESQYRKSNIDVITHNDLLMKNKIADEKLNKNNTVSLYDPLGLQAQQGITQIVGVVEPHGFWSRFVMKHQLGNIIARLNAQKTGKQDGFWVNLINAQSMSQGKDQSRSR